MRKAFIAVIACIGLLSPALLRAQTHVFPAEDTNNTFTGTNAFSGGLSITPRTIATFPVTPPTGTLATASDGASASDCTAGGGSTFVPCVYDGAGWVNFGGGGGSSTPAGANCQLQYNNSGAMGAVTTSCFAAGNLTMTGNSPVIWSNGASNFFTVNMAPSTFVALFADIGGAFANIYEYGTSDPSNMGETIVGHLSAESQGLTVYSDTGAANAYAIPAPSIIGGSTWSLGAQVRFETSHPNSGASTINVNGTGVVNLTKNGTVALVTGDILSGAIYTAIYDGAGWELQNPSTVSGVSVSLIASGTSALGTSSISSAACASVVTTSATGVATTDSIIVSFNADPTGTTGYIPSTAGMLTIIAYPTANNVNFKVCNNTSSPITPGAVTLNWRVVR